jgi:hypothetical protein
MMGRGERHDLFHLYPNILAIIDLIWSSAENERGFSQLKLTKTNGRGRMSNSTLNDVMTVMMETPAVAAFDPQPAINNWLSASARKRRRDSWMESQQRNGRGWRRKRKRRRRRTSDKMMRKMLMRKNQTMR